MTLPTLNLIGPGRLGRTLARLWQQAGLVQVQDLLGRHPDHTHQAIAFIGAGQAASLTTLRPATLTLLATPDDCLADWAEHLASTATLRAQDVVFHCSGALPSGVLTPVRRRGAYVASVHPLTSFAEPALAVQQFAGSYCACEGDAAALAQLAPLFDAIGAQRFAIDPAGKTLYHAGAVLACNDLVALMEAALRCMAGAGVARNQAWAALRPLIDGTLRNLDQLTPNAALTGPVARGDAATVARQLAATRGLDAGTADAYRSLGLLAWELAAAKAEHAPSSTQLAAIRQALGEAA